MRAYMRRLSAQLFILLSPVAPSAYADYRRQSSNMLNFQGQRRQAQAFQPITKALQGHRGPTRCSAQGRMRTIPMHTLACLYFYPRRNLRYAVATHRQPQAWTSALAASAYARMEYKPGFMHQRSTPQETKAHNHAMVQGRLGSSERGIVQVPGWLP